MWSKKMIMNLAHKDVKKFYLYMNASFIFYLYYSNTIYNYFTNYNGTRIHFIIHHYSVKIRLYSLYI